MLSTDSGYGLDGGEEKDNLMNLIQMQSATATQLKAIGELEKSTGKSYGENPPPLSTVRHCFEWIGTHAAELLIELLNGGTGRAVRFPPELIVRESVKAVDERGL